MSALVALLAALGLSLSALGWGRLLLPDADSGLTRGERIAARFLLGMGFLGLALFLVGQLTFGLTSVLPFLLLGLLAFLKPGPERDSLAPPPALRSLPERDLLAAGCLALCAGFLLLLAATGCAGQVALHDGTYYHLLGPASWIRQGAIAPVPFNALTAFPATVETLFAAGMLLTGDDRVVGCLGAVFLGVLLLQTWGLTRRWGGDDRAAAVACALVAAMPALVSQAERAFVDLPFASLTLAAARLVLDGRGRREQLAGAALCGVACGTKYTGLVVLAVLGGICFLQVWRAAGLRAACTRVLGLGSLATLVAAPWYLRNLLVLGTPIYPPYFPAFARLLPPAGFPPEATQALQDLMRVRGQGMGKGPLDLLLAPGRLTFTPAPFHIAGGIGLAPLALGPLGLYLLRRRRELLPWFGVGLGLFLAWFLTQQEGRFLGHVLVLSCTLAGLGAASLLRARTHLPRLLTLGVLGISLAYGTAVLVRERSERLGAAVSPARREALLARDVRCWETTRFLATLPADARILLPLDGPPPYFVPRANWLARGGYGETPRADTPSFAVAARQAQALGFSHVVDARSAGGGFRLEEGPGLRRVHRDARAQVFAVGR